MPIPAIKCCRIWLSRSTGLALVGIHEIGRLILPHCLLWHGAKSGGGHISPLPAQCYWLFWYLSVAAIFLEMGFWSSQSLPHAWQVENSALWRSKMFWMRLESTMTTSHIARTTLKGLMVFDINAVQGAFAKWVEGIVCVGSLSKKMDCSKQNCKICQTVSVQLHFYNDKPYNDL